jgi:hypothetical protein
VNSCASRRLLAASALWLSGHLLPVAKRMRRRHGALAVLWAGVRCAEIAAEAGGAAMIVTRDCRWTAP